MKKILIMLVLAALLLASCGGGNADDKIPSGTEADSTSAISDTVSPESDGDEIDAGTVLDASDYTWIASAAHYTVDQKVFEGLENLGEMQQSSVKHLPLYRIDGTEALEAFKTKYNDIFGLDYPQNGKNSFDENTSHCDSTFYEEKTLFAIYVTTDAAANFFGIRSVGIGGGELQFDVECTLGSGGDMVMTAWLLTAEVKRDFISDCTEFDAVYAGEKAELDITLPSLEKNVRMPKMKISLPNGEYIYSAAGTSSWYYTNSDGTEGAIMADSAHPLNERFFEIMPKLQGLKEADGREAKLIFEHADTSEVYEREPSISVRRWSAEHLEDFEAEAEEVAAVGGAVELNRDGCYIYEVTAEWKTLGGCGGKVTYVFAVGDIE